MRSTRLAIATLARAVAGARSRLGKLGRTRRAQSGHGDSVDVDPAPFRSIIEHANQIIYTLSSPGVFLSVSPTWTPCLGHPVDAVVGRPLDLFVHPDDIPAYRRMLREALGPSHPPVTLEYRVRHLDGTWRWHHAEGARMPPPSGGMDVFVGIARDITGERRTKEELERRLREVRVRYEVSQTLLGKDSEDQVLDALVGAAGIHPDALVSLWTYNGVSADDGVVKRREERFQSGIASTLPTGSHLDMPKYTAISRNTVDGVFWSNDLEHETRIDPPLRALLSREGVGSYGIFLMRVGQGRLGLITVMTRARGFFDDEKILLYRALAEQGAGAMRSALLWEATRDSEERLALVVSQSPLPIVEWDAEFRVVSWNLSAERMFGYASSDVVGQSGFGLIVDPGEKDAITRRMAGFSQDPRPIDIVRSTLTKDGRVLTCRWVSGPRISADGVFTGAISIVEDISARARADQELRESESRYRTLVELTHEGVVIHDRCTIVDVNEPYARMHGRTRDELIGMNVVELVPPWLREVTEQRGGFTGELSYEGESLRADGTVFPTRVMSAAAVFRGRTMRIASVWDVTEERRAKKVLETALRLTQARLQISQALAGTDTEADVAASLREATACLPGALTILYTCDGDPENPEITWRWSVPGAGLEAPLLPTGPFTAAEHPVFRLFLREPELRAMDLESDAQIDTADRELFLGGAARSCAALRLSVANEVLGVILAASAVPGAFDEESAALFDTLAEQGAVALRAARLRTAARSSEDKFRRVAENMRDLVSEVDADGIYCYVSPSYLTELGYEPRDLIGDYIYSRVHPEDLLHVRESFESAVKIGNETESEYRYRLADGSYRWFSTLSKPVFDAAGLFIGAIRDARDVTERRRAHDEVRRLNLELEKRVAERTAQLESANRELEAFSYSVSHDLRAPLRAINGFSRIINDEWGARMPPEVTRYLGLIRDNTTQMALLIDGLLSLSRLSRQPLHVQPVDMTAMVTEIIRDITEQGECPSVAFEVGELPAAAADPVLVRQVWVNLLSNAVKFSRDRPAPHVEVSASARDGRPVFCVRDNGVGFDMRYAGKLFGVFQRLHPAEEYEGTGIGLANVQRIVHRHGGQVWAEAAVDNGAAFFFTL